MIIPSIRFTLSAPYWLSPYGGQTPPVFKIRANDFEFELFQLDSLRQTGTIFVLGHHCQITGIHVSAGHIDLAGQMRSGTQAYIDELLAAGWQLCDEQALARYQLPQAQDPPQPEPRQLWEPQIIGLPAIWPPGHPQAPAPAPAPAPPP